MSDRCIADYTVIHKHKLTHAFTHEQHKHGHVRDIVCSWSNTKVCVEKCIKQRNFDTKYKTKLNSKQQQNLHDNYFMSKNAIDWCSLFTYYRICFRKPETETGTEKDVDGDREIDFLALSLWIIVVLRCTQKITKLVSYGDWIWQRLKKYFDKTKKNWRNRKKTLCHTDDQTLFLSKASSEAGWWNWKPEIKKKKTEQNCTKQRRRH